MPWLSPDSWLDRCGPFAAGLRAEYEPRGGEDALARALVSDPRRIVALVGAPGAASSRMALELARAAPFARYPDPLRCPDPIADVAELAELCAGAAGDVSPLVVLDGPSVEDRLACLVQLTARPIHPRLHVLIPCDAATARRLRRLAGGYPARSILVAAIGGEQVPCEVPAELDLEAVMPFALLGRCAAGRFGGEGTLMTSGAVARSSDGQVVCLLGDRTRAAVVASALIDATRLRDVLSAEPTRHAHAVAALLRWTAERPPLGLLDVLLAVGAGEFPDPLDYWNAGIPLAPQVVDGLVRRGRALVEGCADPNTTARLHQSLSMFAHLQGDDDTAVAELRAGLELEIDAPARARLLTRLAGAEQDAELGAQAVVAARQSGDPTALSNALHQQAALAKAIPDLAAAIAWCNEWIEVEAAHGTAAAVAAARSFAVALAVEADDNVYALSLVEHILDARRAVGDVMGELFARYRHAGALFAVADIDGAADTLRAAVALAEQIDDPTGVGYCHWLLGSIADKRGDPAAADDRYSVAIDAYAAAGSVPPRLLSRQRAASIAATGVKQQAARGDGEALPELEEGRVEAPDQPEPGAPGLIQLVRRNETDDR